MGLEEGQKTLAKMITDVEAIDERVEIAAASAASEALDAAYDH